MLALIAGTGDLPAALVTALPDRPLICALEGFSPRVTADVTFSIERLGGFLADLRARGITHICMAGAVRRPQVRLRRLDLATVPLVPVILRAMRSGDDGALRGFIAVLEAKGFTVVAAHEVAPDLLPPPGVPTRVQPGPGHTLDALMGQGQVALMGTADLGQACVVQDGRVLATEDDAGTDAMLARLTPVTPRKPMEGDPLWWVIDTIADQFAPPPPPEVDLSRAILFKAPKPAQDRRADLPVIGVGTAITAAAAGLAGLVIEAGGVMVLDRAGVIDVLDAQGMFLWVREGDAR
ncbi:hypothetical protein SAMN04488003_1259 [Loktanella fryxellensis]|uniref:Phosphatidate cytidylyltransferase n=1 Tax=Loktanella fryxellensis TaxID=245187 RepID=A0A1H8IBE3_9RHOB|nr:UDP-2,3-diacylglucosamine diphosphatase LpxI [Loktanella fryxellensis]SEN66070.1 hypothetical protein SAMN04488003_1259 [Loktanella fryxellensis]